MLDITRLMRRAGRVLTGVDRVELAYLQALLADPLPVFGLIRSRYGYILLDQMGMAQVAPLMGAGDLWTQVRRVAIGRVPPPFLTGMLRRHVPRGAAYVNVGHSNLTERVLKSMRSAVDARIAVMIHDVIPLEFPEYQRDGSAERFAQMLARVDRYADLIVYNSADTQSRAAAHLHRETASIVAHLGTDIRAPLPSDLALPPSPYFMCVGTIEPRKNHALLLDLWEEMGADAPGLIIAGNRGWKNEDVFARLDALPADGSVKVMHGLSDGTMTALIAGSNGLLFPSHAEGYGLPAIEAAALGVPVLANDLPVYREVLGNIPIYANVTDRYLWIKSIEALAASAPSNAPDAQFVPPSWDAHFKTVLRLT